MRAQNYPKPTQKCSCEFVDIGVGMEKAAEDPYCPVCVEFHEPSMVGDPSRVILAGDTHGDANHVRWLLAQAVKEKAGAVFVLGDFGIWDHLDDGRFTDVVSREAVKAGIPVLFLPGNHDNYDLLFKWEATLPRDGDGFVIVKPHLGYSPRGHRWKWNGINLMSLGGAYSVDKAWRVEKDEQYRRAVTARMERGARISSRDQAFLKTGQWRWWHQEEISQEDLEHALRPGEIDILLTHDKPRKAKPGWDRKDLEACWDNQQAIQDVVDQKKPCLLVHGHLHYPYIDLIDNGEDGTHVQGLDCDPAASLASGGTGRKENSFGVLSLGLKSGYGIGFRSDKTAFVGWGREGRRKVEGTDTHTVSTKNLTPEQAEEARNAFIEVLDDSLRVDMRERIIMPPGSQDRERTGMSEKIRKEREEYLERGRKQLEEDVSESLDEGP